MKKEKPLIEKWKESLLVEDWQREMVIGDLQKLFADEEKKLLNKLDINDMTSNAHTDAFYSLQELRKLCSKILGNPEGEERK